ncbi:MAG: hypothetical protein V4488_07995 [Pseudomonadota bacterium]
MEVQNVLIEKAKLSKGMSYPLKSSFLETAFSAQGISLDAHLRQGGTSTLFECFFWPPNANVTHERLYIRTSAVPSNKTREARLFIEESVVPELIAWLQGILALAPTATIRREAQRFERVLP